MAGEVFYRDANGQKRDAAIHDAILAEGDATDERVWARRYMLGIGMTEEDVDRLLGDKSILRPD